MRILAVIAHPRMQESKVNRTWMIRLNEEWGITVHDLYASYPDRAIAVEKEQSLLLAHDRIVFQHPFYWYSAPAFF